MYSNAYVNWMQHFSLYETQDTLYIVASDSKRSNFHIMRIARKSVPFCDYHTHPTLLSETPMDRMWRLDIQADPHLYNSEEISSLILSFKSNNQDFYRTPTNDYSTASGSFDSTLTASGKVQSASFQTLGKTLTAFGLIGLIRFVMGYYLIVITQRREVARLGEHKIYRVEDTKMVYIPRVDSEALNDSPLMHSAATAAEEQRFLKLFQSIELNRHFYFSYTYDLTNSLQDNMEPMLQQNSDCSVFRLVPNSRFLWNFPLVPPQFQPTKSGISNWFVGLVHGFAKQASLVSCGMPISILLLGRRSRLFAGTRFLKRGASLDGNVANEVETEQIVCDTAESALSRSRVSSVVQIRGSVPLFWSQDTTGIVVVGKPPLAITWEDPYFEAFGSHFAYLMRRHGAPIIVLNLMKQQEKKRFEQQLTDGFVRGINYLRQFAPKIYPPPETGQGVSTTETAGISPIIYTGFDLARVQSSPNLIALECLRPIVEGGLRETGLFFSLGFTADGTTEDGDHLDVARTRLHMGSDLSPRQHGVIRTNCVDCLDRTNTGQFMIGYVAIGYQLRAMGLLDQPNLPFSSAITKLLQDLYQEHGDALALQYAGSCVVHSIETYGKPGVSRVKSRNIVQTISRYYSNNFIDCGKQQATNLFLRIFRPGAKYIPSFNNNGTDQHDYHSADISTDISCSQGGMAFLFNSDASIEAHIHWLHAISRLSKKRPALTSWYPRDTLVARQKKLGRWGIWKSVDDGPVDEQEAECPKIRLKLAPGDPGLDWYSELYQPHDWTHFRDIGFYQLPVNSPKTKTKSTLVDAARPPHISMVLQNPPLLGPHVASLRHLRKSHSFSDMGKGGDHESSVVSIRITEKNKHHAFPKIFSMTRMEEDHNSSDSDSQFVDSFIVVSPQSVGARWGLKTPTSHIVKPIQSPIKAPLPPNETQRNLPVSSALKTILNEPMSTFVGKFSRVRLSELTHTSNRILKRSMYDESPVKEISNTMEDSKQSAVLCFRDIVSSHASPIQTGPPSPRDLQIYEDYVSLQFAEASATRNVLSVKQGSLKIYADSVKISEGDVLSIPMESITTYKNSVNQQNRRQHIK